jgi:hypothetical protein
LLRRQCHARGHSEADGDGESDGGEVAGMSHRVLLLFRAQRVKATMRIERSNRKMTDC